MLNNKVVKEWLKQFDQKDLGLATTFLKCIKLVSNNEFEETITNLLLDIRKETTGKKRIALFPINDKDKLRAKEEDKRYQFNSADRVGQMLTNIERSYKKDFINSPTIKSMKAERVDNIVLVDDFIGSGKRVHDYCKMSLSSTIKSWISFKYCKIWIVTYSVTEEGLNFIKNKFNYLNENNIKYSLLISKTNFLVNEHLVEFLENYGFKTFRPPLGYKNICSNIVFQHGCPNTNPSILWAHSRYWKALFPNQGVHPEFIECFGKKSLARESELLWKINQRKLALKFLESENLNKLNKGELLLILILSLIQKGYPYTKIYKLILEPITIIKGVIDNAEKIGLIKDGVLTVFGRDLILKSKLLKTNSKKTAPFNKSLIGNYYPIQLNGLQR